MGYLDPLKEKKSKLTVKAPEEKEETQKVSEGVNFQTRLLVD